MSVILPITANGRYAISTASGGETSFSVPFPFQANADVTIVKVSAAGAETILTEGTHYTLTGAGDPAGGTVTLTAPLAAGEKLKRIGNAVLTRTADVTRAGRFRSRATDDELDRLTIIAQEHARELARGVTVALGQPTPKPIPALEAGKLLIVNDAGDGIEMGPDASDIADAEANALSAAASRAAAEDAQSLAEDARDQAVAAAASVTAPKTTLALVEADTPASDPDYYAVAYRDSNFRTGSGARYRKVASEPTHEGKVQNGNGTWYELDEDVVYTAMFGAVADGATDDTSAINAAVAYCKTRSNPHLVISPGDHACGSTVTIDLPDWSKLTFMGAIKTTIAGAGQAVQIGSSDTTKSTFGLQAEGIDVYHATGNRNLWALVNLLNHAFGTFRFRRLTGGGAGLYIVPTAVNGGFSYNKVYLGQHHDSTVNLYLSASGSGYCNENNFYGGSFNHSSSWPAETASVNIVVDHFAASPLNNNRFHEPSLEDNHSATYARAANISGIHNSIINPRLENSADQDSYLISLTANSVSCIVEARSFWVKQANVSDNGTSNTVITLEGERLKHATPATAGFSVHSAQSTFTSSAKVYSGRDSGGVERFYVTGSGDVFTATKLQIGAPGYGVFTHSGTPEGSVSANPGSLCIDTTGGPPWFKNSGSGNTGWLRCAAAV